MRTLLLAAALSACTSGNLHEECKTHEECPSGQVCSFEVCVDEGSAQGQVCREGRTYCDGSCVDTLSVLETCGGCDGCAEVENAQALACNQGSCIYVCDDGWRDTDDNTANGCECAPGVDCDCQPTGDEVCDGLDNDCDGGVDNVPDPVDGATWVRNCGTRPHATPAACGVSGCVFSCEMGFHDRNNDMDDGCECEASPEVCDGEDNDCNGIIDDGDPTVLCPAPEGAVGACAGRACIYQCTLEHQDVDGDLRSGPDGNGCECSPTGAELCDGIDNDCDGLTDMDDPGLSTGECPLQSGVCRGAVASCFGGTEVTCGFAEYARAANTAGLVYSGTYERWCDSIDDDCDGQVDEDCCPSPTRSFLRAPADLAEPPSVAAVKDIADDVVLFESDVRGWFATTVDVESARPADTVELGVQNGRVGAVFQGGAVVGVVVSGTRLDYVRLDSEGAVVARGGVDLPSAVDHAFRPLQGITASGGRIVFILDGSHGVFAVHGMYTGDRVPRVVHLDSSGVAVTGSAALEGGRVLYVGEYLEARPSRQFVQELVVGTESIELGVQRRIDGVAPQEPHLVHPPRLPGSVATTTGLLPSEPGTVRIAVMTLRAPQEQFPYGIQAYDVDVQSLALTPNPLLDDVEAGIPSFKAIVPALGGAVVVGWASEWRSDGSGVNLFPTGINSSTIVADTSRGWLITSCDHGSFETEFVTSGTVFGFLSEDGDLLCVGE